MTRKSLFIVFTVVFFIGRLPGAAPVAGAQEAARQGGVLHGESAALPDILDIKVLDASPFASPRLLSIGAVALLAFGAGVYGLARNRKKKAAPLSPYECALQALSALERENLLPKGEIIRYYSELSGIVRDDLESACGLKATARTTEELLSEMGERGTLLSLQGGLLSGFLTRCDRVKFAGYRPSPEEAAALLASAREIIEQMKECTADAIS
jgi:hypothetical protein